MVLAAEPGSGKTTRLPPALATARSGQILILEPRRVAAVAAATRIADEQGWELGREVGYQVRFDNRTSKDTRLIFMTEALLTRRLLRDPELKGVGAVVLDEFHERSLHTDLALGLVKELQDIGRDITIVVMSATLDNAQVSQYLEGCPVVSVPGRTFPLDIQYLARPMPRGRLESTYFSDLVKTIEWAARETPGDVLVFLPGIGEIERTRDLLVESRQVQTREILLLHGSLALEEQRRALVPGQRPRIILATNVAETSLTVPGVTTVVDTGLAKVMRQDPRTGFQKLELTRISRAAAAQRAGRAARLGPGRAIRLWSESEQATLPEFDTPEIARADLSDALLCLAAQGIRDPNRFQWFEAPPAANLERARAELTSLEAITPDFVLTDLGRELLSRPLPARLAKIVVVAEKLGAIRLGADLAALLSEKDLLRAGRAVDHFADRHECDLALRLELLEKWRRGERDVDILDNVARQVDRVSQQIAPATARVGQADNLVAEILLRSFPDRLCRRRGKSDRGLMVGGRGVRLSPDSQVREAEFFLALEAIDLEQQADTQVRVATAIDRSLIEKVFGARIDKGSITAFVNQRFETRQVRRLFGLILEESAPTPARPEEIHEALVDELINRLDWLKQQNQEFKRWFERWTFFLRHHPELSWSDVELRQALSLAAFGRSSLQDVAAADLVTYFTAQIPGSTRAQFDREVPDTLEVPSGQRHRIQYPDDRSPYLEVRLQEVFGWRETPRILNGKVPLVLYLLAPNFRLVQTTNDLASFWQSGYFEVRKELKSRYPKHSWPEDPLTAAAVAKGRRKLPH